MDKERYAEFEWTAPMRGEVKPLLNDAQKADIERLLVKDFMLTKHEAQDCADTISGCAAASGARIKMVIAEALPEKMKASFKDKAAEQILGIVTLAIDQRNAPAVTQVVAPAAPAQKAAVTKNNI